MRSKALTRDEVRSMTERDLFRCPEALRQVFARIAFEPVQWRQSPWGDQNGGFWVLAVQDDRVLWYNDIEDGFQVSRFEHAGTIPDHEYWCNDDPIKWAIPRLGGPLRHPPSQP